MNNRSRNNNNENIDTSTSTRYKHQRLSQDEDDYEYNNNNDEEDFDINPSNSSLMAANEEEEEFEFDPGLYSFEDEIEFDNKYNVYQNERREKKQKMMKTMALLKEKSSSFLPLKLVFFLLLTIVFGTTLYIHLARGGITRIEFHPFAGDDDDDNNNDNDGDFLIADIPKEEEESLLSSSKMLENTTTSSSSKCNPLSYDIHSHEVHFNPDANLNQRDPFQVHDPTWYGGIFQNPPHPSIPVESFDDIDGHISDDNVGFIKDPDIFNNTVVFCSEGDLYLTHINDDKEVLPAMRLTSTEGNVISPKINPKYPFLIAFTATYTGHREVYLMDLRPNHRSNPSMRLTYTDSEYGVLGIAGWEDDGTSLVVSSYNREVAMEDVRLYKIGVLVNNQKQESNISSDNKNHPRMTQNQQNRFSVSSSQSVTISNIKAIPLSQAIDAVVDNDSECRYFTRFKQSSNTARYVGGTAENIWAYCSGEAIAVPLTNDYNGTSKDPEIYAASNGKKYLFFLSDRNLVNNEWSPSTMNVWVTLLPKKRHIYGNRSNKLLPIKITSISCKTGMHVQEFAIDRTNGNVILRVGADLHIITASEITNIITAKSTSISAEVSKLPIVVYSDFNNLHERIIPIRYPSHVTTIDAFGTSFGTISALMTARGQVFVNPVIPDTEALRPYGGGAMNLPPRRYRVAPGSLTGGMIRIHGSWFIPNSNSLALALATDPLSPTAEMAFYILDVSPGSMINFDDVSNLPVPFIGGHVNGGSVLEGGLGSISVESVVISPCGRRFAWTDTDGRIVVMTFPTYSTNSNDLYVLPQTNNVNEPMTGIDARLTFSPAGRYLAIEHSARNKFRIITIGDLGDPSSHELIPNQFVQATADRFNSMSPLWGRSPVDFKVESTQTNGSDTKMSTTLFFLTDRDVILSRNSSPWGTRAPQPFFGKNTLVYALPLTTTEDEGIINPLYDVFRGSFVGGGASELISDRLVKISQEMDDKINITSSESQNQEDSAPLDLEINFGDQTDEMAFARRAYVISEIPPLEYVFIHQLSDDASLILAMKNSDGTLNLAVFAYGSFPQNSLKEVSIDVPGKSLNDIGISSDREFIYITYSGVTKIIKNSAEEFMSKIVGDVEFSKNIVDTEDWAISVWPKLEYQQMYSDAWRMLRDFYYDPNMGSVDWNAVHGKYLPLVGRCGKREELDDVLKQMASELSALHVFVYGGEYNDPLHGSYEATSANQIASLGAVLERSMEWGGYIVKEIPESDPDFNPLDGYMIYSPLSDKTLKMSGQRGLLPGDVIVSVNGEAVLSSPDINMLLRGMSGRSIRLEVLRVESKSALKRHSEISDSIISEPLIVVPISPANASTLRYSAWEWKTRSEAKKLAREAGFTIGYMHLQSMSGSQGEDAFVRGFYPDFDKQGLIIDVRHNHGGNIDSWLLDVLQRKAWMFWQGRATNITTGGLGWDEHYAFRGHIVVLTDEKTSSDGEGFSRGISELGLGKLVGTRTWGGGIWLSSDNTLVDRGIATAPEFGTYNANFGWGLGIEQLGVTPDFIVDNNPREAYDGKDAQLELAIQILRDWILEEPIVIPKAPVAHKNMALSKKAEGCSA